LRSGSGDEVKARLLAKVAEVKDDPKFFQYELGDGEMQLQGPQWKDRVVHGTGQASSAAKVLSTRTTR
jgi:hypothetical protein